MAPPRSAIRNHAGVRKIKSAATPTIYPNQYYTDFGGGSGNQFKHIFIGSERILTKKTHIAPDREHWFYHGDHLHSTAMVTNEKSQLVDAVHYFPFGEVWFEERPSSLPADYFFTAKEFDPETGFYNFGVRYLDPRFSKWMTADPALGEYLPGAGKTVAYQSPSLANGWRTSPALPALGGAFQPQNIAVYGYAHSNPGTFTDLWGTEADLPERPTGFNAGFWFGAIRMQSDEPGKTKTLHEGDLAFNTGAFVGNIVGPVVVVWTTGVIGQRIGGAWSAASQRVRNAWQRMRGEYEIGDRLPNGTIAGSSPLSAGVPAGSRVNMPAWKRIQIDMEEVESGHMVGGKRLAPGNKKDIFPEDMSQAQVERAIRNAYRNGEVQYLQGVDRDRAFVVGPFGSHGTIEMWVNKTTKIIETAWPKYR
jgi:RHS repeat-associated protein